MKLVHKVILSIGLFLLISIAVFIILNNKKSVIVNSTHESGLMQNSLSLSTNTTFTFNHSQTYRPYVPLSFELGSLNLDEGQTLSVQVFDTNNQFLPDIYGQLTQRDFLSPFNKSNQIYLDPKYVAGIQVQFSLHNAQGGIIASNRIDIPLYTLSSKNIPQDKIFLSLDLEDLFSSRHILTKNRKEGTSEDLEEWFAFLRPDVVMLPSGISKEYDSEKNLVWDQKKYNESMELAKAIHKNNIEVAMWINPLRIPYSPNTEFPYLFSEHGDGYNPLSANIVSIQDENRKKDIIFMINRNLANTDVDYVGLNGMFYQEYFEELKDDFKAQDIPEILKTEQSFQMWKKFKMVSYWQDIFSMVNTQKLSFALFNGQELIDDPEYIPMAFSAGIDLVFINLESSINNFEQQWDLIHQAPVSLFADRIIYSYCLNYNNVYKGDKSAIDNWLNHHQTISKKFNNHSLMINDFYRALLGYRGSYPAYEWLMAIGNLISDWRAQYQKNDIEWRVEPTANIDTHQIDFQMMIRNISPSNMYDLKMDLLPLSGYDIQELLTVDKLLAGSSIQTNITLTNFEFVQKLFKKKSYYLGFSLAYRNTKNNNIIKIFSFDDPNIKEDSRFVSEDSLNKRIISIIQDKKRKEEERRLQELARLKEIELSNKKNTENKNHSNDVLSNNLETSTNKKALSWWERMKIERAEKRRLKEQEKMKNDKK